MIHLFFYERPSQMTKADLQADDPETIELNFTCGGKEKLKAVYRTVIFLLAVIYLPVQALGYTKARAQIFAQGLSLFFYFFLISGWGI